MTARRQQGMTLVELMVVVAIVGVLAAVAIFMYTRYVKTGRTTEIPAVFTEFANKQERYYVENNEYLSTTETDDETDVFPPSPTETGPDTIDNPPDRWRDLSINLSQSELWCQYVIVAGQAGDTPAGAIGATLIPDPAPEDYWYGIAKCPFNGKTYVMKYNENRPVER